MSGSRGSSGYGSTAVEGRQLGKEMLIGGLALKRRDITKWYHSQLSRFHRRVCCSCVGIVCMASVDLEWSHNMAHTPALDTRTWPRGDVPSLGLTDEDINLKGVRM